MCMYMYAHVILRELASPSFDVTAVIRNCCIRTQSVGPLTFTHLRLRAFVHRRYHLE